MSDVDEHSRFTIEVSPAAARFVMWRLLMPATALRSLIGLVRSGPLTAASTAALVVGADLLPLPIRIVCGLTLLVGIIVELRRMPRGRTYGIGVRDGDYLIAAQRIVVDSSRRTMTLAGIYVVPCHRRSGLASALLSGLLELIAVEVSQGGPIRVESYLPVHPGSRRRVEKLGGRSVTYASAAAARSAAEHVSAWSFEIPVSPSFFLSTSGC